MNIKELNCSPWCRNPRKLRPKQHSTPLISDEKTEKLLRHPFYTNVEMEFLFPLRYTGHHDEMSASGPTSEAQP
ncbi:hypothetical protein [Halomonas sp. ND22Bw]|uniref:hypothetical protein n=1 Tax=Halomonas sp. ND22Bw TaxID=2054178 RepID=UPI0015E69A03